MQLQIPPLKLVIIAVYLSKLNLPFFSVSPPPIMNSARLSIIFFMNEAFVPVTFLPNTTPIASCHQVNKRYLLSQA